jgi:hypothetical protein
MFNMSRAGVTVVRVATLGVGFSASCLSDSCGSMSRQVLSFVGVETSGAPTLGVACVGVAIFVLFRLIIHELRRSASRCLPSDALA